MTSRLQGHDHRSGGAGGDSIAGYEYQIDVSVWLALDLVLAHKLTHELVLEPPSQEDIEAELEEFEPGRVTSTAQVSDYRLIVQAKLRGGNPWTVAGVRTLLKHGKVRESAAKRLLKPDARYLLVTNAALSGKTLGLRVRRAGAWPKPGDMAATFVNMLPPGAAGRVAVVANQDVERLDSDIKQLLTESFRVPAARWAECHRALRDQARIRIARGGSGRWTREELERVIHAHDGYIASSHELEHYVHPTNWADLRSAMSSRHGALILGQSGTGKTMATKKLYEELRKAIPGLARVAVTLGPQQLRDDQTPSPVLYDIEDPWGRYDFDPKSRPWNDQLAQFLAHAPHDRMIVATSRRDVAQSAGVLDGLKTWIVPLESEHYGRAQRQRLYRTRIDALPRILQPVAVEGERAVLAKLGTPLEIQKFFDALPALDRTGIRNVPGFIGEAISRAHQDSIEITVVNQIEARDETRAAAVLWAMLKVNDKLSQNVLRIIEEGLADREPKLDRGVSPLVTFFVAARNLRSTDEVVSYYHPRVESGIEQALLRNPLIVRRTLQLLADVLVALDGQAEGWGTATAAKLIAAAERQPALKPNASKVAQNKIDLWLRSELAKGGKAFGATLRLAVAAGSAESNVSEAARFLYHRPDQSFGGMDKWGPPAHDEAWYARLRSDPAIQPLIATFITDILPNERDDYRRGFVVEVERLATDLSEAFLAAAAQAVYHGVMYTSDAIVEGALKNLDGFEPIIDAAIGVLTPSATERLEAEATHLAIVNNELSDDYAEYLADNEDGYTAREFLDSYVHRVRIERGWESLAKHRHREWLLWYWLRELSKDTAPRTDEVAGAFTAGYGSKNEDDLWYVIRKTWDPNYLDPLVNRLLVGHEVREVRIAALACLLEWAPGELASISQVLISRSNYDRLVEIAIEVGELRERESRPSEPPFLDATVVAPRPNFAVAGVAALPPMYAELSEAALALKMNKKPMLSDRTRDHAGQVNGASEEVRLFKVTLDRHVMLPIADDVRWLLANAREPDLAVEAIEAAIRHGMTNEIATALTHRFAHVVARALLDIATPLPAPLPAHLLALAEVKGSPVRKALVKLLGEKPHKDHLPTLYQLAHDEWSTSSPRHNEPENYPIAQAAVEAIGKLGYPPDDTANGLYDLAISTSDYRLRYQVFLLLGGGADAAMQRRLFELAVGPGRRDVSRAAVGALLASAKNVVPEVVAGITADLIATRIEPVAARLSMLLAWRGELSAVETAAKALATNNRRRVLLLLIIRIMTVRDRAVAEGIAGMLPPDHPAIPWAFGGEIDVSDNLLDNLGDPLSVAEVLPYLKAEKA